MTPEQIQEIIAALKAIASGPKGYTLTGAADWPLLIIVGAGLVVLLGMMWADLRANIRDNRSEWKGEATTIWAAMKDCQDDCCPRGKKQ